MSRWYPCVYCTEDLHCTKYPDDSCESWCVLGPCLDETPSNADHIRSMTDEELARFFFDDPFRMYLKTPQENLKWLKEEAKE